MRPRLFRVPRSSHAQAYATITATDRRRYRHFRLGFEGAGGRDFRFVALDVRTGFCRSLRWLVAGQGFRRGRIPLWQLLPPGAMGRLRRLL